MKILYYSPHPHLNFSSLSGPGTHMREVVKGFEDLGHTVVKVIMGGEVLADGVPSTTALGGIKSKVKKFVPSTFWQTLKDERLIKLDEKYARGLEEIILREQPQLIYERANYLMTSGVEMAKRHGIKHILELNAPYPEEKISMEGRPSEAMLEKARFAEKNQVALSSRVIVVSSALKSYLLEQHKVPADKILVIPNAVNPSHIQLGQRSSSSHTVVGFVGSIFPYHGVHHLVEAMSNLKKAFPGLRALVIGDGETLPDLREQARQLRVDDVIQFTGNLPRQTAFSKIAEMDICVMPTSNWYGSPVKIFEYGALGKAVIAPNNAPVRDVMEHEKDGLLIEETSEDLAKAITRLLTDIALRDALAKHFQNKVLNHYTWGHVVQKTLADL
jgi:glycosyltransferase involved in cell wall biosynthesis